ncbi:Proteinase inhibitor I25, cystatin, conserved region [Trema orientale]|uniref:Proteinase inhibitor I25, cystatin, conserved region n=1 Tax=Trema orientale TaxID=63057 RepID=A0A2P5EU05_TREOI|nr:Proteinase inhibitor I25, cystatin, conserved region [Trema orientale]
MNNGSVHNGAIIEVKEGGLASAVNQSLILRRPRVPNPEEVSYDENLAVYERNKKLLREYKKQVRAYECFHVDVKVFYRGDSIITPVEKDDELMTAKVEASVAFAVEKYNQSEGKDLKLKRVVKANVQIVLGFNFCLTLERQMTSASTRLRSVKYYPLVSEQKTEEKI